MRELTGVSINVWNHSSSMSSDHTQVFYVEVGSDTAEIVSFYRTRRIERYWRADQ